MAKNWVQEKRTQSANSAGAEFVEPPESRQHFRHHAEDAAWISSAVDAAVAGAPLEEALGLYPGWRTAHRMRQQEVLIRELVDRFGPLSSSEVARKIDRFACGSQRWSPGSVEELMFYVVRAGKPPSARTIRRVIEAGRSVTQNRTDPDLGSPPREPPARLAYCPDFQ